MSVYFGRSGNLNVRANIASVDVTIQFKWNDRFDIAGTALTSISGAGESWSRKLLDSEGKQSRTVTVSSYSGSERRYNFSYTRTQTGGGSVAATPNKDSDSTLSFRDDDGTDKNAYFTITSISNVRYLEQAPSPTPTPTPTPSPTPTPEPPPREDRFEQNGPTSCPLPTPWSSILPTCGLPPRGTFSPDGLQVSVDPSNSSRVILNLRNYPNKLVTVKVTQEVTGSWTQGFSFSAPNCSDISPSTGGVEYSRGDFSSNNIRGTNVFFLYNLDGGEYNYTFTHSSTPGSRPQREVQYLSCSTSSFTNETGGTTSVQTCTCNSYQESWSGAWPYCTVGASIVQSGGTRVQWVYEDGSGGNYNDQRVTIELISTRNAVPFQGAICMSSLRASAWIVDGERINASGRCLADYAKHSEKIRFRIPSIAASKTVFNDPSCFNELRGVAGAITPGTEGGVLNPQYPVLHLFDRDFLVTTSIVTDRDIQVVPKNEKDVYESANILTDPEINTLNRKHYHVYFLDGTEVLADPVTGEVSNIDVQTGLNLSAGGISGTLISKAKKVPGTQNQMYVWFSMNAGDSEDITDQIVHETETQENGTSVTIESESELTSPSITVEPQNLDDTGVASGDPNYVTLNTENKKYYLITFEDNTVIQNANASDINIQIITQATSDASGEVTKINISKVEKLPNTPEGKAQMRVWFVGYYPARPAGQDIDNVFVREFTISRRRAVNFSGNVFARNWYLSKELQ